MRLLVRSGADVKLRIYTGDTVMHLLVQTKAKLLADSAWDIGMLGNEFVDIMEPGMISRGSDIASDVLSPLEMGVSPTIPNEGGNNPLDLAWKECHELLSTSYGIWLWTITDLLIRNGADPDHPRGDVPL